jgi:hypothetical protein
MSQSERSRPDGQAEGAVVSIKEHAPLEEALREGARQMLLQAIETEVEMREMRDRSAIGPPSGLMDRRESGTSRSAGCNVIRITLRLELG